MRVETFDDARAFRDAVEPYLLRDEPRHNLIFGLVGTLVDHPEVYPAFHCWRVEADGETVGAALRTPPHMLVLAAPARDDVLPALARHLAAEHASLPGVVGGLPEADAFAMHYAEATGHRESGRMQQGIYALERVEPVPVPSGRVRGATPDDLELLLRWQRAFHEDVDGALEWNEDETRRRMLPRLASDGEAGYRIWEDGEPVSLAGFSGPTRTGVRIGPVYTPPAKRSLGYATALVADLSRELLARGRRFCFLYTDMANPTSNAIYRRIGYRLVCGSAMIHLTR